MSSKIDAVITWFDPCTNPPPFGTKLLLMLSGHNSHDAGATYQAYSIVLTGRIKEGGPADDWEDTLTIDDWLSSDQADFPNYQFYIHAEDTDDESDWFSDSIIAWALYPDGVAKTFMGKTKVRA